MSSATEKIPCATDPLSHLPENRVGDGATSDPTVQNSDPFAGFHQSPTPQEVRGYAANQIFTTDLRTAMFVVLMWLVKQPKTETAASRRRAGDYIRNANNGVTNSDSIASALFPNVPRRLVLAKAQLLIRLTDADLCERVHFFTQNMLENRCRFTEEHVRFAGEYVSRIEEQKPDMNTFLRDNETWSPDFP